MRSPKNKAGAVAAFSLALRHAENLAEFTAKLESQRFWHIVPSGETAAEKAIGLLDTETYLIYPPVSALRAFLDQHPFVHIQEGGKTLSTLHAAKKLLWNNDASETSCSLEEGRKKVAKARWAGLSEWRLPSPAQLKEFATAAKNPYRSGQEFRLKYSNGSETCNWLTNEGAVDTDKSRWDVSGYRSGNIFSCHPYFKNTSDQELIIELSSRGWTLCSPEGQTMLFNADSRWQKLSKEERLFAMRKELVHLLGKIADHKSEVILKHSDSLRDQMSMYDYTPCRLPILDEAQLSDPEKGLWELWGEDTALCKQLNLVARDPKRDIQRRAVAIDFGTSSTVVACETSSGGRELLRIGVRDFFQVVQPQHFENPTVLECLDFDAFLLAWTSQAYRPQLDWNWMRAAHEAQASFRDNPGDTRILASILPRLKQWALRDSEHRRIQLTDRQGCEIELPLHIERNPLRGQALQVCAEDPFDPVELYAWYLGMAINWRGHGLFLKYYLSFPVEYPREVRERILASFRRGLQRSLPHTLVSHYPETLNEFTVQALASEPAAYAAAALAYLKIDPCEAGVPYAVYDFGGGTTDFDFGFLRWAKGEEEDKGYEQVFEHLANSGDKYLGGENLIEHMSYQTFQHNLDELRQHRIQFTRPMDAAPFAGGEAFVAQTQAAQTNTVMLSARLRPFLESEQPDLPAQIKLELIDANGQRQVCELVLDAVALDALLLERMRAGVHAFLADLARVSSELPVAPVHVLLAGNGSRSRHIHALFDAQGEHWPALLQQHFGDNPPEMVIHAPLPMDDKNPHAPTAKTGVALGLLHLVPGENTLLIDHLQRRNDGQAPFAWFVGRLRRRVFEPAMSPSASYGHWHELGALQEGMFNLYTSLSPRAHTGLAEGDAELIKHRLEFAAAPVGSRLFVRACSPHEIELAAALEAPSGDDVAEVQKLHLG